VNGRGVELFSFFNASKLDAFDRLCKTTNPCRFKIVGELKTPGGGHVNFVRHMYERLPKSSREDGVLHYA